MSRKSTQNVSESSITYISMWVFCACASVGYIAYLLHTGPTKHSDAYQIKTSKLELNKQKSELSRLREMISITNHSLNQVNTKNTLIQSKLSSLEKSQLMAEQSRSVVMAKLGKIEDALGTVTGALQTRKKPTKPKEVIKPVKELKPVEPVKAPKSDIPEIKIEIPVKKSPPPEKPVTKVGAAKPVKLEKKPILLQTNFAVALGDYSNLKKLKQAWKKIKSKHKPDMATLSPRYVQILANNKIRYELISGPLRNALDAAQLCYRLHQAETACKQAIFQGKKI